MIIIITKMVVEYIILEEDLLGTDAMIIGNLDSNEHSGGLEQKNTSSETGP